MAFHRLTVPSYFGGLPGGYDYINNAVSGTPAFADGQKGAGPNIGTYFIAFGEDATSSDANRPSQALAQNTDYLDDLLHRDLAIPSKLDATAVGAVSSLNFPAGTFVGVSGTPSTPAGIATFVKVLDQNENEIVPTGSGGVACAVTSISGAVVGAGFSAGVVTFNIVPSIPDTTLYRIVYAQRGNLATLPADAFTTVKIISSQELPAAFEDFVKQVSRESGLNVLALVGNQLETPDGTRLTKQNSWFFDADQDGSVGGTHRFVMRSARDTVGAKILLEANDDTSLGGAALGRLKIGSGLVQEFVGTGYFRDANVAASSGSGGAFLPWTSATTALGDQFLRVFERGSVGTGIVPTLLRSLNGRWTCVVGDGTNSFGDFSGVDAIQQAIAFFTAVSGGTTLHIKLKRGSYTIDNTYGVVALAANWDVTLEGLSTKDTVITTASTAAPIQLGTATLLRLKNLKIVRSSGSTTGLSDTANSRIYAEDCCFYNFSVYAKNAGLAQAGSITGAMAHTFRRCHFETNTLTKPALIWEFSDAGVHAGFLVEDCSFYINDSNTPATRIQAGAGMTVNALATGFKFVRTDFHLGSAAVVANLPTGNCGALELVDNGTLYGGFLQFGLNLADVSFIDCNVYAGSAKSSDATVTLLNIPAVGVRLGTLTIRGGKWLVMKNSPTLTPFYYTGYTGSLAADISVRDTTMGWADAGDFSGNGTSVTTSYGQMPAYGSTPASVYDHAAFYLYGQTVSLRNINLVGAWSLSTAGELWIDGATGVDVDIVNLSVADSGAGTTKPNYRLRLTPSNAGATVVGTALRKVRRVTLNGATNMLNTLTSVPKGPMLVLPFGQLEIEDCLFRQCGTTTTGACIVVPVQGDGVYIADNNAVAGLKIRRCRIEGATTSTQGIQIYHNGAAAHPVSDIAGLEITDCVIRNCVHEGISILGADSTTTCLFSGALIDGNYVYDNGATYQQIAFLPSAFGFGTKNAPVITRNRAGHSSGASTVGIAFGNNKAAGDNPAGVVVGNSCWNQSASFGTIGIRLPGGAALPTTERTNGALLRLAGVEAGFEYNASTNYRAFDISGNVTTLHNAAALVHLA